ncbi:DsrE family protein [Methanoregula sp.]|uniref:DsrE family protein n=1 Tax=Methanoregula sp. TaxID=2052170 RepID=UPI002C5F2139|nr:DsrE family protein [Methanoregula sp.]HVP97315.1 DsrE family protein [Methanoregula sp.]
MKIICDRDALEHRGISLEPLPERFMDQISTLPGDDQKGSPSFWTALISAARDRCRQHPPQIGWLQISSPYMFPSSEYGIRCLTTALNLGCGVSLYACLDGCHIFHTGQNPENRENLGEATERLAKQAAEKNIPCTVTSSRYSASARGYQSWDDGMGTIGSSFAIKSSHIRDVGVLIRQSRDVHLLLSENAGIIYNASHDEVKDPYPGSPLLHDPAVVILITHSPYSTEYAYGAISLAVACAHEGIPAHVIFLEEGIFVLTGEHRAPGESGAITLPELISRLSGSENLQFFVLASSLHKRGMVKNGTLAAVTEIGFDELGALLFAPSDTGESSRRILFF